MSSAASTVRPGRIKRDEYRQWLRSNPRGRFERIDGNVVATAAEPASHADWKALVWLALHDAVAAAKRPCHVGPDGVTADPALRHPRRKP